MTDEPESPDPLARLRTSATAYPNREAARHALEGEVRRAANRFFRDATSKSIDFSIAFLAGGYHLSYFSPARTPGYGKRHHQIIDSEGRVLREYKETWSPNGLIETNWLHGASDDD